MPSTKVTLILSLSWTGPHLLLPQICICVYIFFLVLFRAMRKWEPEQSVSLFSIPWARWGLRVRDRFFTRVWEKHLPPYKWCQDWCYECQGMLMRFGGSMTQCLTCGQHVSTCISNSCFHFSLSLSTEAEDHFNKLFADALCHNSGWVFGKWLLTGQIR